MISLFDVMLYVPTWARILKVQRSVLAREECVIQILSEPMGDYEQSPESRCRRGGYRVACKSNYQAETSKFSCAKLVTVSTAQPRD
jgi:hypothetical protein